MLNALSEHSFKIKFGHDQSSLPKISILMWKTACINTCWIYKNISDNAVKINFSNQPYMYNLPSRLDLSIRHFLFYMEKYLFDFTVIYRILIRVQIHRFSLIIPFITERYYPIQNSTIPYRMKTEMLFQKHEVLRITLHIIYRRKKRQLQARKS